MSAFLACISMHTLPLRFLDIELAFRAEITTQFPNLLNLIEYPSKRETCAFTEVFAGLHERFIEACAACGQLGMRH